MNKSISFRILHWVYGHIKVDLNCCMSPRPTQPQNVPPCVSLIYRIRIPTRNVLIAPWEEVLFTRQSGRNKIRRDVGFVYCEAGHTISKSRDIESMHCAKIGTFVVGAFFVSCMGKGVAIAVGG